MKTLVAVQVYRECDPTARVCTATLLSSEEVV